MATASMSELTERAAEYLEIVEMGGKVVIRDGEEVVGMLVPTVEAERVLHQLLSEMSSRDADILRALLLEEKSKAQIATQFEVDESNLRVRLFNAKKLLKKRFLAKVDSRDWLDERIAQLIAEGRIRPALEPFPDDFLTRPRPRFAGGSVLEELLNERRESRW